jgi:hypothetical protein
MMVPVSSIPTRARLSHPTKGGFPSLLQSCIKRAITAYTRELLRFNTTNLLSTRATAAAAWSYCLVAVRKRQQIQA